MTLEHDERLFAERLMPFQSEPEILGYTLDDLLHPSSGNPIRIGLIVMKTSANGTNVDSINDVILKLTSSGQYDVLVGPEYSFMHFEGPLSEAEKDAYLEGMKQATAGKDMLLIPGTFVWQKDGKMYNTAYVVRNGNVFYEYHKMTDGGDINIAQKHGLILHQGKVPGVFEWGNLKLSLEICSDGSSVYAAGITAGLFEKDIKDKDLQILVSAGTFFTSVVVCPGGYIAKTNGLLRKFNYVMQIN